MTLGHSSTTFCSPSRPHTGNLKTAWVRSPPPGERKQKWFWLRFALRRGRFVSRISSGPARVLAASGFEPYLRISKDRGKSRAKGKAQPPGGIIPGVRVVPLSKGISKGMIPKDCKRLAEVDFPVAEVSRHSAREKSIRHGHPSTLHLWWARRPLAACRAMLMALLLPDPCDLNCPVEFREEASQLLKPMPNCGATGSNKELRDSLLKFIADFANWGNSAKPAYLKCARELVKAAHGEDPPLVVDPFAGGGSIPLEALRVGCDTSASDLNPVACLIDRVLLEDIPRYTDELSKRFLEQVILLKRALRERIGDLYPHVGNGDNVVAYLWARVARCEAPRCGASIPLLRSTWLSRSSVQPRALSLVVKKSPGDVPEIKVAVFTPKKPDDVRGGTVLGGKAVCPACSIPLSRSRIEAQLKGKRGGTNSAWLVAVITGI